MKRTITCITLLLTILLAQSASAELTRLTDNVYSYVGMTDASPAKSFAANAGIVIGKDGVLVVDTLISAKEAELFLADIRKVTGKPIKYVVNTHTHLDHALGNCVFARLGATVISHEADRASLAAQAESMLKRLDKYGLTADDTVRTEVVVPSLAFSEQMLIDLGGVEVRLIRSFPSHTAGSTVVFLPKEKILFAGDILFTDFHPFMADGDFSGWGKTLDSLMNMDIERIVPGHGPLSSKKDLKDMKEYIAIFDRTAKELVAKGGTPETIVAELKDKLPKRSLADWMIGYNLKTRYLEKKQ
jgi:glyoxylase-like metal-dependent hydrolase (beta-lactamase superfamily II)